MSNRICIQAIAVTVFLLAAIVLYANSVLFPTVKIAKNTQTVNHTYEPAKPTPQYGPPLAPGCKAQCNRGGGGGTIRIGG